MATSVEVITEHIGGIQLGEIELPGHVQSLQVEGNTVKDDARVASRSGRFAQPLGYEDARVTVRLRLLDNPAGRTAEDQVKQLDSLYKSLDAQGRPEVWRLVNSHTKARGIRDVTWDSFRSAGQSSQGGLEVELVFAEFRPPIIQKEKAASWKAAFAAALAGGLTTFAEAADAASGTVVGALGDAASAFRAAEQAYGLAVKPMLDEAAARERIERRARTKAEAVVRKTRTRTVADVANENERDFSMAALAAEPGL